jgi:predicted dienelactone hydrolase
MWRAVLVAVFVLLVARPASAEDCATSSVGFRVVHFGHTVVAVWYPTTAPAALHAYSPRFSGMVAVDAPPGTACHTPVPLVIFSHGFTGCGMQSIALTEELARHGYVVSAPDHADALFCHIDPEASGPPSHLTRPSFIRADTWTDATFADRRDDIVATIDGLLADKDFRDVIDAKSIGAMGHSLGGYTVVAMAGGWASWRDPRIRAVLALSPYVAPFEVHHTLQGIRIPLMYQGGTLDIGITPFLQGPNGAYRQANPPAFFVELRNAGHLAWVNCGGARTTESCQAAKLNIGLINEYGIAFFDAYLKHKAEPVLKAKDPALAAYDFKLSPE